MCNENREGRAATKWSPRSSRIEPPTRIIRHLRHLTGGPGLTYPTEPTPPTATNPWLDFGVGELAGSRDGPCSDPDSAQRWPTVNQWIRIRSSILQLSLFQKMVHVMVAIGSKAPVSYRRCIMYSVPTCICIRICGASRMMDKFSESWGHSRDMATILGTN